MNFIKTIILILLFQNQVIKADFKYKIIKPAVLGTACLISSIKFFNCCDSSFNYSQKKFNSLIEHWKTDSNKQKLGKLTKSGLSAAFSLVSLSVGIVYAVPCFYYFDEAYKILSKKLIRI